ncbi:MAG: glycosyltransferase family 39 protein [Chloroflexota bacterium]|nr:glycosyltransferase family 39 protein [Chloroflexota bacterium]
MNRRDTRVLLAALALLGIAAFLILNLDRLHMHPDEELSYRATEGDLIDVLRWQIELQDNQAPLWFVILRIWRTFAGDAEATSRVMGILLVLPALALLMRWARLVVGWRAAIILPLLLVGNGMFFQYTLDIRMYPLVMLTAALSTYALFRWSHERTPRSAALYGITLALMLYTHYLLIFLIAAHGLFVLWIIAADRRRVRRIIVEAGAAAIGAALWLPWLPVMLTQIAHLRAVEAASGTARGGVGIGVSTLATTQESVEALIGFASNGLAPLYALLAVVGVALAWRHGRAARRTLVLALLWAVGSTAITLIVNRVAGVYAPRYVAHLTLGIALVIAVPVALLPIGRLARGLLVVGFVVLNLATFSASLPIRIPYRDLLQQLGAAAQPDDVILLARGGEGDGFVQWQLQHYLPLALRDNITTDLDSALRSPRIWLLTGDWFNQSVRATFDAIEPDYPLRLVIGDCTRSWCYLAQLLQVRDRPAFE